MITHFVYDIFTVAPNVLLMCAFNWFQDKMTNSKPSSSGTQRQPKGAIQNRKHVSDNNRHDLYMQQRIQLSTLCHENVEFSDASSLLMCTSSQSTDTLPVQPRDAAELGETYRMNELKVLHAESDDKEFTGASVSSSFGGVLSCALETVSEHFQVKHVEEFNERNRFLPVNNSTSLNNQMKPPINDSISNSSVPITHNYYSISDKNVFTISPGDESRLPSRSCTHLKKVSRPVYPRNFSKEDDTPENSTMTSQREAITRNCELNLNDYLQVKTKNSLRSEKNQSAQLHYQQASSESDTETIPKEYMYPRQGSFCLPQHTAFIREPRDETEQQLNVPIQEPPDQWDYDKLLVDLNNMITDKDELNSMKGRFRSTFGKAAMGRITRPMDLFRKMEECNFLNENNIIYLQSILLELKRPDVIVKTIEYCSRTDQVLHFQTCRKIPVNGFGYVGFHLYLDKQYTKGEITVMQSRVAKILCVDETLVFVVGVEKTNSILVTLMLPEMYIGILESYLLQNRLHDRFAALDIDTIYIAEKSYSIEVPVPAGHDVGAMGSDETMSSLHHQLLSRTHLLEDSRKACTQLRQDAETMSKQDADTTAHLAEFEKICKQLRTHVSVVGVMEEHTESDKHLDKIEKRCKVLHSDLESQRESRNRLQQCYKTKCKHLEEILSFIFSFIQMIRTLEKRNDEIETLKIKLQILEKECLSKDMQNRQLMSNESAVKSKLQILKQECLDKDQTQQHMVWNELQLKYVYHSLSEYIASLNHHVTQLETDMNFAVILHDKEPNSPTRKSTQEGLILMAERWFKRMLWFMYEVKAVNVAQNNHKIMISLLNEYVPLSNVANVENEQKFVRNLPKNIKFDEDSGVEEDS